MISKNSPHKLYINRTYKNITKGYKNMVIASAIQNVTLINVYDDRGYLLCVIPAGNAPGDGLRGFTSSIVSVKVGELVLIYNEYGYIAANVPA